MGPTARRAVAATLGAAALVSALAGCDTDDGRELPDTVYIRPPTTPPTTMFDPLTGDTFDSFGTLLPTEP